ncbi:MAG: transporter substrate-binding domain-containing protein [Clostridia bacterium]|nr:transporter substrate-binding domain-containing protein [Clostridia bacterium]
MQNKICLYLLVLMLFCMILAGCGEKVPEEVEDTSLRDIKEKGYMVLGVNDSIPPLSFIDRNEQISGFDIELVQEIANRLGVELNFETVGQQDGITELENKNIDLLNGVIVSDEMKEKIEYSMNYLNKRYLYVIRRDSDISSIDGLSNIKIGMLEGVSNQLDSEKYVWMTNNEVVTFSSKQEALMELGLGKIDMVIMDEWFAKHINTQRPSEFKWLDEKIDSGAYSMAFNKKDILFKQEVDRIIGEMMNDGFIENLSRKWFGERVITQ